MTSSRRKKKKPPATKVRLKALRELKEWLSIGAVQKRSVNVFQVYQPLIIDLYNFNGSGIGGFVGICINVIDC
jgi:hypothetical protein